VPPTLSSEYSPEDWIMAASFWLVLVEACALPPVPTLMPQPPTQLTFPDKDRWPPE